jgi:cell division protein FtsI (penicillin-binding protein 3)
MIKIWKSLLKLRIIGVFFVIFTFGLLLIIKAFSLQIINGGRLRKLADAQFHTEIYFTPKRGNIYASNGSLLATSVNIPGVAVDPLMVRHKYKDALKLSNILHVNFKNVLKILNQDLQFVWIKKRVSGENAKKVENLNISGIRIVEQPVRYYPNGSLLAHVLGFVGINDNGLSGVEYRYNNYLKGSRHALKVLQDGLGQDIFIKGFGLSKETHGDNIYLTINKRIQYVTQHYLDEEGKLTDARGAFAIVMNPNTGAILAMADYPSFNPNYYYRYKPRYWRNRAVTDDFEPGSTMKPFIIAGALQDEIIKPDTMINGHHGVYGLDGIVVHDVGNGFGRLTINQLIEYSCNVCACQVGMKMGKRKVYTWLRRWGFNSNPHAGLLGENPGILRPLRGWSKIGPCEEAFGQGAAINGLQEIRALSAIVNGGYLMRPYIIKKITNSYGRVIVKTKPKVIRKVINGKADKEIKYMMRIVVKGGTGEYAKLIDYKVSGKTGTGQIINPKTGKYYKKLYNASFMAFVPYHHPKLVMLIVIQKPKKISYYGGAVAAPVVREVFKRSLDILNLYPGKNAYTKQVNERMPFKKTGQIANDNKNKKNDLNLLRSDIIPNLKGYTMMRALNTIRSYNINIKIQGNGFLYYQSIKPGSKVKKGQIIILKFRPLHGE